MRRHPGECKRPVRESQESPRARGAAPGPETGTGFVGKVFDAIVPREYSRLLRFCRGLVLVISPAPPTLAALAGDLDPGCPGRQGGTSSCYGLLARPAARRLPPRK